MRLGSLILVSILFLSIFIPVLSYAIPSTINAPVKQTSLENLQNINTQSEYRTALQNVLNKFNEAKEISKTLTPKEKIVGVLSEYLTGNIPSELKVYPSPQLTLTDTSTKIDKEALSEGVEVGIVVVADENVDFDQVGEFINIRRVYPLGFGWIIVGSVDSPQKLVKLASLESVIEVMGDIKVTYPKERMIPEEMIPEAGLNQMFAKYILGSYNASVVFGVNGSGVVIAIVDTGVDFGNPDLRQARAPSGVPLSIDVDGIGIGLATLAINATDVNADNATLPTAGQSIVFQYYGRYYLTHLEYNITISRAQYNASQSKTFRVGIFPYTDASLQKVYYVPFVMIDTHTPGVYDQVYFDLSTFYAEALNDSGDPFGLLDPAYIDHSIADEQPHAWGNGTEVIARDFTGDGIPDISMGTLAWSYDTFRYGGLGLIPGIGAVDTHTSSALGLGYDEWPVIAIQWARDDSHGTSAAGAAASMGLHDWFIVNVSDPHGYSMVKIPGMAPGAAVMGINPWYVGDMISAWFWAAGLDYNSTTKWYDYNAWHHADVCSNSWGISSYLAGSVAPGFYVYELLVDLLSIPGYFNDTYPGMVFTIATGNGGYGYGTTTTPAAASLAISVGASTEWLYWTYYGGFPSPQGVGEIIPWSNRGPTTMGEVKPDIVAIGAYAADINAINYIGTFGYAIGLLGFAGDGVYTATIFGGTSQATPMAAGAAAVVIEALKKNNLSWDPVLVKNILMSTADDLGYDPYVQGAGRVNILKAVQYVYAMAGKASTSVKNSVLAYTYDSWKNILIFKNSSYYSAGGALLNTTKVPMASLYGGILQPGDSRTYTVAVDTYISSPTTYTLTPEFFNVTKYVEFTEYIRSGVDAYAINLTDTLADYGISKSDFDGADLVNIYVAIDGHAFDEGYIAAPYVYLVDWHDENGDGVYTHSTEMHRINADFRSGPVFLVSVGKPGSTFTGTPTLVIRHISDPGIAVKILIALFKRVTWSDFSVSAVSQSTISYGTRFNFTVTLNVPSDAMPGMYEGVFHIVVANGSTTADYYMPVSYAVMYKLTTPGKVYLFEFNNKTEYTTYENYVVFGGEDLSWRWESGDYRFYPLLVQDSSAKGLLIDVSWTGEYTQIDVIVTFNNSQILATSDIKYVSAGIFNYSTTAPEEQLLWVPYVGSGIYTVVIHNTRADGVEFPEGIELRAVYLTEDPYTINWAITSGLTAFNDGYMYGWLNASVAPSTQTSGLLTIDSIDLIISQLNSFVGTLTTSSPSIMAPWGISYPGAEYTVYIPANATVSATLDWSYAQDLDLVIYDPTGSLIPNWAESATSNHPEHIEFVASMSGYYTFDIMMYSGTYAVYDLEVAVSILSESYSSTSFSFDTNATIGDLRNALITLKFHGNGIVPDYTKVVNIDNGNETVIQPGNSILGNSTQEKINVLTEPAVIDYFYNFTFLNGTEIQSGVLKWNESIVIDTTTLPEGYYKLYLETNTVYFPRYDNYTGYVLIDKGSPTIAVSGINDGDYLQGLVSVSISVHETNVIGGPFSPYGPNTLVVVNNYLWDYAPLNGTYVLNTTEISDYFGDGPANVMFLFYDDAGKYTYVSYDVNIDNYAPNLVVIGISNETYYFGPFNATIIATDAYLRNVTIIIDNGAPIDLGGSNGTYIFDLASGDHTIDIIAYDYFNRTTLAHYLVHIVREPIDLDVFLTSEGTTEYVAGNLNVSYTARALYFDKAEIFVDGVSVANLTTATGSYIIDTTAYADGTHTVNVTVYYTSGEVDSKQFTIDIDNTNPVVSFVSPEDGAYVSMIINVSWTITEEHLKSVTLYIDADAIDVTGRSYYLLLTNYISDGEHTLSLEVEDEAGHVVVTSITIVVDNTAPVARIFYPEAGTYISGTLYIRYLIDEENVKEAYFTIGGNQYSINVINGTYTIDVSGLSTGTYELSLTVVDAVGHTTVYSVRINIDNDAPQVSITAPENGTAVLGLLTINWTVSDPNLEAVYLVIDGNTEIEVTGNSTTFDTTRLGDGWHTIAIRAIDKAGNVNTAEIMIKTENYQAQTSAYSTGTLVLGLGSGIAVGAVIIAVIALVLAKKRS